ncbi:MAG: serine hydrolase [Calditrichaeota bacterium]|nr:serine hydrolase [Calditrichota bacterium]
MMPIKHWKRWIVFIFMLLMMGCAVTRQTVPENWVERTLATMTLEEKVGQMMVVTYKPLFYNEHDPQFQRLIRLVKDYHIGSISIYKGAPYAVARYIQRLQAAADIPLIVMADTEWGIEMRVEEATTFLPNMAIGATRSETYAYEMGKITAEEARAIGIHVGFAPVMDVNNNPDNIIINTRSYGEDPQLVARLGQAFIRGMQENGVFATAKHFPGHGDTDVDSHLGLPVIRVSKERLEQVELVPFQAAVDAGVKFVMTAHITYSGIPEMQGRPATLDPYFIQKVLREKMGFQGLVITDAMGMGGIVNNYWSGEAAVMAINAGADFLLDPPNFEVTYQFVLDAVREGRIPMARIDESVRRILRAKQELGLTHGPQLDIARLEKVMANPEHLRKAEEIANAAMTLLRDEPGIIPLKADRLDSVLVVTITDREWGYIYQRNLEREVQRRIPVVRSALIDTRTSQEELRRILAKADSAQVIIAGIFVTWGSYKGSVTLPDTTVSLINELFRIDKPIAVVSFGSPYIIRQIPDVPTYLCAYHSGELAIRAGVRAIFGEIPVRGKLPVSIPGLFQIGDGLERPAYAMELVKDIQDDFLKDAYAVLEQAIRDSVFPGAQVAIVHDGRLIASRGFGRQTYDPRSPEVTPETIYDLASITKVAATTVVAMQLWEKNLIRLDIPVKSYLPRFTGGMKDSVTLRHLLTHSGGLHWWAPLWKVARNKAEALEYIYNLPLDYAPGDSMIYSDLGMILVGEVLRVVTGKTIDQLAEEMIYRPMGMTNTMFNPPKSLLPRIAPTEIGGSMNRGLIHGEVHDENTYFLGGVSSHAGLFSTAEDLARLAQMLLNGGIYRHHRFFSPETIRYWTARQNIPPGSERALGWDTPSDHGSSAGDYFSKGSFGHLGFTGTSMWVDPNRKIAIILLANRVHPTRERGGIYQVRRDFHNAAMKALLKWLGEEVPEAPEPVEASHS